MASDFPGRVTLAELVAMLSLVADLGMGRPMERVLRQTVVAMRLGAAAGMDPATRNLTKRSGSYPIRFRQWIRRTDP